MIVSIDMLKFFFTFVFLGGILRRWIYDKVTNLVLRFILIGALVAGLILLFIGEHILSHAILFGSVIIAVAFGMYLDITLDNTTTHIAKMRNGKV